MASLNWRKNSMLVLSLLLAVLLWIYVTNVQNPLKEQDFRVALHTQGELGQGLVASGWPEQVTVRVQGNNSQLAGLMSSDFQARLDLSGLTEGETTRLVQVIAPAGIQVLGANPDRVSIKVERIVQHRVPVIISLRGNPATGYTAGEPVVQPATVLIQGPDTLISGVKNINLTVNIQGISQGYEQTLLVRLPKGVTANLDHVKVMVPVNQSTLTKSLTVVPQVTGTPATGYQVGSGSAKPDTVQISGPPELLNNLKSVNTEAVSVDGANKDITQQAKIQLPQGITTVTPDTVTVTVPVSPAVNGTGTGTGSTGASALPPETTKPGTGASNR